MAYFVVDPTTGKLTEATGELAESSQCVLCRLFTYKDDLGKISHNVYVQFAAHYPCAQQLIQNLCQLLHPLNDCIIKVQLASTITYQTC